MPDEFMDELDAEEQRGESAVDTHLTQNVSDNKHCRACHDDGWCSVDMTIADMGTTYSGFAAPCTLCQVGAAVYLCMTSGTDYRFGAAVKPKEQPWRSQDVWLISDHARIDGNVCAVCAPRGLTWDEYLGSDQGREDPHADACREMLAVAQSKPRKQGPWRREETPEPIVPQKRRSFSGRFAQATPTPEGDSVGSSPSERSEE